MRVEWMMLANAVDVRNGLLFMMGGGWDTVNAYVEPGSETGGPVTALRGALVFRVLLSRVELEKTHEIEIRVIDADGQDVVDAVRLPMMVPRIDNTPEGWDQGHLVTMDVTGLPVPNAGIYEFALSINGNYLSSSKFRVVIQEEPPPHELVGLG